MELLAKLEQKHRLPKGLLSAVMKQESGGNVNAVSPKGARGAFQFMPATAAQYGVDVSSLESSADGAARMYADLLKLHNGDVDKALASYNWGQGNVNKKGMAQAPKETRDYIMKIKSNMPKSEAQSEYINDPELLAQLDADDGYVTNEALLAQLDAEDAPQEVTTEQALQMRKEGKSLANVKVKQVSMKDDLQSEIDANPVQAGFAAAGSGLSDIIEGTKQLFGKENKQQIAANSQFRDNNKLAAIAGDVATFAGTGLAAPVTNTVKGAAALGGAYGFLSPTEGATSTGDMLKRKTGNALVVGGLGTGVTKGMTGIVNKVGQKQADNALKQSQNANSDAILKEVLDAGYTAPRSLYNPSFLSNRLESVGGKAAMKQQAASQNQEVTNNLARKALGVPESTPLSMKTVETVRKQAYKPYEEIANISKGAANTLDDLKQNRADATAWFNSYNRSANPEHLTKAKEFKEVADLAENVLEDYAKNAGKPQLVNQLKDARKTIAKTYTVERALNKTTDTIDPKVLGRLYDKGKPLSDGLDTIGKYANTFKPLTGINPQGAGVSALEPMAMAGMGMLGNVATGSPTGLLAAGLPLLRHPARAAALSKLLQKPKMYNLSAKDLLMQKLLSARNAPMAITGATLPAFTQ